jgi:hypothetical protein
MVRQDQIDRMLSKETQCLVARSGSQDRVAFAFKHELSDGQLILFVVYT